MMKNQGGSFKDAFLISLTRLSQSDDEDACRASLDIISTLSEYNTLGYINEAVKVQVVQNLEHQVVFVRRIAVKTLSKLSIHSETHNTFKEVVPLLVNLFVDDCGVGDEARREMLNMLGNVKLHDTIEGMIPEIINWLEGPSHAMRSGGAQVLCMILDRIGPYQIIQEAVPQLLKLFGDEDISSQWRAALALSKMSEYTELQDAITPAIPPFIKALGARQMDLSSEIKPTLLNISKSPKLCSAVEAEIPQMAKLLEHEESWGRSRAAYLLSSLSECAELHTSMEETIPLLFRLIQDDDLSVRQQAIFALAHMSKYAKLRNSVENVVPRIMEFLEHSDPMTRRGGFGALEIFIGNSEQPNAIWYTIPTLSKLLSDQDSYVRCSVITALLKLSRNDPNHGIEGLFPEVIKLTEDLDSATQRIAVESLSTMIEYTQSPDIVKEVIFHLIKLLKTQPGYIRMPALTALLSIF
ncbi:ARM repeat-containing protein [Serendipita vermifera]|nr:ARM repeat-containing protein [Serendipita vermifera]